MTIEGNRHRKEAATQVRRASRLAAKASSVVQCGASGLPGPWKDRLEGLQEEYAHAGPELSSLLGWANEATRCLSSAVADSAHSASVLMSQGLATQVGALAVARVCLECTSRLNYLVSDADKMVERALPMRWQDLEAERPMIEWARTTPNPVTNSIVSGDTAFTEVAQGLGWEVDVGPTGRLKLSRDDQSSARVPSATQLIADLPFRGAEQLWRMTSGVSHGRPWMISHELRSPDVPVPAAASKTAAEAVIGSVSITAHIIGEAFGDAALARAAERLVDTIVAAQ